MHCTLHCQDPRRYLRTLVLLIGLAMTSTGWVTARKELRDILLPLARGFADLTNTSRPSVKPWVWSPPESPVLNKLSVPSLPRWLCLQRWSRISMTSLRVCARSRHVQPLHQMYRVPGPQWNKLTAPQAAWSHGPGSSEDNRNTRRRLDPSSSAEDEQSRSAVLY